MFMLRGARAAITFSESSDPSSDISPRPPSYTLPKDSKSQDSFKKMMKIGQQPVTKKGPAAKMALVMNYLDILGNMVSFLCLIIVLECPSDYTFFNPLYSPSSTNFLKPRLVLPPTLGDFFECASHTNHQWNSQYVVGFQSKIQQRSGRVGYNESL